MMFTLIYARDRLISTINQKDYNIEIIKVVISVFLSDHNSGTDLSQMLSKELGRIKGMFKRPTS